MKGRLIGVDVGGTSIKVGIVSRGGHVSSYIEEKVTDPRSMASINGQLTLIIDRLFTKDVSGIGIGVPAIVDISRGTVHEAVNLPGWKRVSLKSLVEKKYRRKVIINNDANCFALGESMFGLAKGYDNMVGVIIGTGFGAGIVMDNRIYNGNNCAAGEFGRIPVGSKTVEDICSGKFFIRRYKTEGRHLYQRAIKGDKRSRRSFIEFGHNMGIGLSMIVNSVDPGIIIIGGSVAGSHKLFKDSMIKSLKDHVYHKVFSNLKIRFSSGKKMGVIGAASLMLQK